MMQEYIQVVSNLGFPIFVAIWFMLRMEKVIKNNTNSLKEIQKVMEKCPARE